MNRINQLFNSNKKDLLSIYFCAGDPTLDGTADVIRTLEKHGVSMIEVGIPFSDPMADGIVIQNAATQALRNGMSLKVLFEQHPPGCKNPISINGLFKPDYAVRIRKFLSQMRGVRNRRCYYS